MNGAGQHIDPWAAVAAYAKRVGVHGIGNLPGCWEVELDDQWWFAVNGHGEEVRCTRNTSVPPWSLYIEYAGWPAAIINVTGGSFVRGGRANKEEFIALLKKPVT